MGRVFLIQYDLTPDSEFFLCRFCQAHIARLDKINSEAIFLSKANVLIDGPERYRIEEADVVANVHCTGCNALLGIKYIEVQNNDGLVEAESFKLHLNNLLWWDGNVFHSYPNQIQAHRLVTAHDDGI
ncbi:uncharacterized protein LOC132269472 [Cornus florida]|uniref:uncharacterized protein LOC132269472 n=1 Tax=Cornus florida TaxID=4283 RepID=UPI00289DF9AD|nr:uncharacterized protein LOC132269472 [Cornus florida]